MHTKQSFYEYLNSGPQSLSIGGGSEGEDIDLSYLETRGEDNLERDDQGYMNYEGLKINPMGRILEDK